MQTSLFRQTLCSPWQIPLLWSLLLLIIVLERAMNNNCGVGRRKSLGQYHFIAETQRGRGRTEAQTQSLQSPLIPCSRENTNYVPGLIGGRPGNGTWLSPRVPLSIIIFSPACLLLKLWCYRSKVEKWILLQ